jgi:hypothetical protein
VKSLAQHLSTARRLCSVAPASGLRFVTRIEKPQSGFLQKTIDWFSTSRQLDRNVALTFQTAEWH